MAVKKIDKSQYDFDKDGKFDRFEFKAMEADITKAKDPPGTTYEITDGNTKLVDGALNELESKIEKSGEFTKAAEADEPKGDTDKLKFYEARKSALENALKNASSDEAKQKINEQLKAVEAQIATLTAKQDAAKKDSAQLKSQITSSDSKQQGSGASGESKGGTGSKATSTGNTGFTPPAGWGSSAKASDASAFNPSAMYQSDFKSAALGDATDAVNKNVNRGKQLMMLFAYFARMAASGDMGAMYQFMKFITYIISKDKAKQQIDMGKKLIQLQDLSRKFTDQLLGLKTDASDPNTSNEIMMTMTKVKSETEAIATSQKLISQMMEEFSQVVESLTNTTKAALEADGRIKRTVSQIR